MSSQNRQTSISKKVCIYFNRPEGCKYGDKCFNQHVKHVKAAPQYGTNVCIKYMTPYGCPLNNKCLCQHIPKERIDEICFFDLIHENGCTNKKCKYWHRPDVSVKVVDINSLELFYTYMDGSQHRLVCSTIHEVISFYGTLRVQNIEKKRLMRKTKMPNSHKHLIMC